MTPPSKQLDQFVLRLPDGMRDRIKAAAEANNRSMNAEIILALENWLGGVRSPSAIDMERQDAEQLDIVRARLANTEALQTLMIEKLAHILEKLEATPSKE